MPANAFAGGPRVIRDVIYGLVYMRQGCEDRPKAGGLSDGGDVVVLHRLSAASDGDRRDGVTWCGMLRGPSENHGNVLRPILPGRALLFSQLMGLYEAEGGIMRKRKTQMIRNDADLGPPKHQSSAVKYSVMLVAAQLAKASYFPAKLGGHWPHLRRGWRLSRKSESSKGIQGLVAHSDT